VIAKTIVEKQTECRLAGDTKVLLGENLSQRPLLSITKFHVTSPGFEPGLPRWEAGDYYYYYLVCEATGTAATPGLLCQPWVVVKMIVEKQMECRLAGETEVL
jgi:hypothetical protein